MVKTFSNVVTSVKGFITAPFRKVSQKTNRKLNSNSLLGALKTKEVQRKILVTLGLLLVYRVLAAVPLPGVDIDAFNSAFGSSPLNGIFTLLTGGRLDSPSLVAVGLGAYINASVIIQLLTSVVPKFEELQKEGERGRKVLNMYTRFLAVPLNLIQAYVIYTLLKSTPSSAALIAGATTMDIITMVFAMTAGSMVLMWLGELITEHGIGNGSSIIIAVSILSVLPGLIVTDFSKFVSGDLSLVMRGNLAALFSNNMIFIYLVIAVFLFLIYGVTFITESTRRIMIQYASRVRAAQSGQSSYLPLKINQAGVMPVIFGSYLMSFPIMIAQFLVGLSKEGELLYRIGNKVLNSFLYRAYDQGRPADLLLYELLTVILIVFFTYFYTFVTYKPSDTADNLKKGGGFIPGIRPGKETENFIRTVLIRLTFWGAIFLGIVAIIPSLLRMFPQGSSLTLLLGMGGTSVLIVVGTITDTIRQIKSVAVTRSYEQFR